MKERILNYLIELKNYYWNKYLLTSDNIYYNKASELTDIIYKIGFENINIGGNK